MKRGGKRARSPAVQPKMGTMSGRNGSRELPLQVEPGPTPGVKRVLDGGGAGLVLAVLWPIWLLTLALIKLDSPGPAIVRQKRVGLDNREFTFYKFRTMVDSPHNDLAER